MNLKFGGYYQEKWIYDLKLCVGLDFYGVPTNDIEFMEILTGASCNEIAASRILDSLKLGQHKQVTVMAGLFFDEIGDELKEIGVQMTIIPPYIYKNPNHIEDNLKIDFAALAEIKGEKANTYLMDLTNEQKEEVKKRVIQTRNNLKNTKNHKII